MEPFEPPAVRHSESAGVFRLGHAPSLKMTGTIIWLEGEVSLAAGRVSCRNKDWAAGKISLTQLARLPTRSRILLSGSIRLYV